MLDERVTLNIIYLVFSSKYVVNCAIAKIFIELLRPSYARKLQL